VRPAHGFRVVVLGGGISGLAAAHFLRKLYSPAHLDLTLVEADPRLGGKVRTDSLAGRPVEGGPDGFLARVPEALELCRDLGLAESLISPGGGPAYLWTHGRLRAIPGGLMLGVPTGLSGIAFTGLLSPFGIARAALDLVLPRTRLARDESVSRLVAARFGSEVAERLVDPLLSGIYAGDAGELVLAADGVAAALVGVLDDVVDLDDGGSEVGEDLGDQGEPAGDVFVVE
jgi:oxygen-dependent protoporphyrinogen oxidase